MKSLLTTGVLFQVLLCTACNYTIPSDYSIITDSLSIMPDYSGITVPCNIAPLNFRISEPALSYLVRFSSVAYSFNVHSKNGKIIIPSKKWKKLMVRNKGTQYSVEVFIKDTRKKWSKFPTIINAIASEPIDPYLVYRLIEPGYELWNEMGIYQRNLENFEEQSIMVNSMSDNNCMNCHSFQNNNPNTMSLHMRGKHAGTFIFIDKKLKCINTKTENTISAGVYTSWHPDESLIAFSNNKTIQFFHAVPDKRIEVFDQESDIVIYDLINDSITLPAILNTKTHLETFPNWSSDGRYLYYCSAEAKNLNQYNKLKYDIVRIGYNTGKNEFGETDTMYKANSYNKSALMPRCSPDGNWLLMTVTGYGNFGIWHNDADLYVINLKTNKVNILYSNSDRSESFHSWSSNSKWIVFSSRRDDGQFTRPYMAYFDQSVGNTKKPFVLPQKDPEFYNYCLKAYNLPELVTGKIQVSPYDFRKALK